MLECLSVAYSVRRNLQSYHVPPLPIQGGSGTRGGGTDDTLWLVENAYASREDHQIPGGGELKQKHRNEVAEEVCGNCVQMLGGDIHPNRGGRKSQNTSRGYRCSNTSGWCWTSQTTRVQKSYVTSGRCGRCGTGLGSCYEGRGHIHLSWKRFITHYFSWCCFLEQKCGCYWRHVNTNSFTYRISMLATLCYILDVKLPPSQTFDNFPWYSGVSYSES